MVGWRGVKWNPEEWVYSERQFVRMAVTPGGYFGNPVAAGCAIMLGVLWQYADNGKVSALI
jgi:hypothetical protein